MQDNSIDLTQFNITPFNPNKPTILLLSDDLNAPSGIGTMAKTFVYGTVDRFNWIQVASAIKHPDTGKIIDISQKVSIETGIFDASVKLYPYSGYGDQNLIRYILENEKVDGILHFTDPRFWLWLYQMEHELHTTYKIPLMYYSIWDNLPYPLWNFPYYASCDLIMGISRQSHIIHEQVLKYGNNPTLDITGLKDSDEIKDKVDKNTTLVSYVPHGINPDIYKPITPESPEYAEYQSFVSNFNKKHNSKFLVLWNNRNISRKLGSSVILAFQRFVSTLPIEERNSCVLLMHTDPIDSNGTDLVSCHEVLTPECNVVFSSMKMDSKGMNFYYNLADVTINIASNEGFGLSSAESIMAGTMVINNVTGGLQDQLRFSNSDGTWWRPTKETPSNHTGLVSNCGKWGIPIFPENRTLNGSVATPYILDDRCNVYDVALAIWTIYTLDRTDRKAYGLEGRNWLLSKESHMSSEEMSNGIANGINICLQTFKPKDSYECIIVNEKTKLEYSGLIN